MALELFSLFAKISLDSSELDKGLDKSKKSMSDYKKDVMTLAQTYKQQGMSMSDAMKKAYAEIDKSQYETASVSGKTSKTVSGNWGDAANKLGAVGGKLKDALGVAIKAAAVGLTAASAGVVAFGKSSVDAGMQFDSSMAQVAATMGKTVDEIGNLRDFAMEMGAKTAFSASQAADALNYMALAGYDAETSMSMLPNVLNLAAAGGMELAAASDMITDSQSALGLSLDETAALVDKMAKASSKSNTSVSQLGSAILTVGGTAKAMKGGTTELAQVLGIIADNGVKGAEGGTALRNIILSLTAPTDKAAKSLKDLGVEVMDSSGNMRSMKDIFADLNKAMSNMSEGKKTEVLSEIFNKVDLKSVNALMGTNIERWDELAASIENSKYAAEKMGDVQLDNLAGDVTFFKSALEGAQIMVSDMLTPSLREFVQLGTSGLTAVTDAFKQATEAQSLADSFHDAEGALRPLEELAAETTERFGQTAAVASTISFTDAEGSLKEVSAFADELVGKLSSMSYDEQLNIAKFFGLGGEDGKGAVDDLWEILDPVNELDWKLQKMMEAGAAASSGDMNILESLFPEYTQEEILSWFDGSEEGVAALKKAIGEVDSSTITDGFSAAMEALPGVINDGIAMLMEGVPKVFEVGGQVLGAVVGGIATNLPVLKDGAVQVATTFADYLSGEVESALDSIGILEPVTEAFSGVGEAFDRIGESVSPLIEKFKEWATSEETAQDATGLLATSLTLLGDTMSVAAGFISDIVDVGSRLATTITDNIALFAGLAGAAGVFMTALEINTLMGFATQLGGLTGVLSAVQGAVSTATIGFKGAFAILAANPIIAVVTVIGFLVTAFITAYKTSEDFRNKVNGALQAVKTFIDNFVAAVDNFFTVTIPNAFQATIAKVTEVKNTIVSKFNEAADFIASLPGKFYQWGKDMMDNFKRAIAENPITNAISGVANTVASFLHHSTPDVGPLKDDDTWMPDMMRMFADGIESNTPLIGDAAQEAAESVSSALEPARDWAAEIGEYVSVDLANGIEKKATKAQQAAEKVASNIYNGLSEWADKTTKYERLSLEEQLDMWNAILARFKKGTEQWADAYDKVWDIQEQIADERKKAEEEAAKEAEKAEKERTKAAEQAVKDRYSAVTKWLDKAAKYTDASYTTQMQMWRQALGKFERDSEQYADIEEKLFDLRLSAYEE